MLNLTELMNEYAANLLENMRTAGPIIVKAFIRRILRPFG